MATEPVARLRTQQILDGAMRVIESPSWTSFRNSGQQPIRLTLGGLTLEGLIPENPIGDPEHLVPLTTEQQGIIVQPGETLTVNQNPANVRGGIHMPITGHIVDARGEPIEPERPSLARQMQAMGRVIRPGEDFTARVEWPVANAMLRPLSQPLYDTEIFPANSDEVVFFSNPRTHHRKGRKKNRIFIETPLRPVPIVKTEISIMEFISSLIQTISNMERFGGYLKPYAQSVIEALACAQGISFTNATPDRTGKLEIRFKGRRREAEFVRHLCSQKMIIAALNSHNPAPLEYEIEVVEMITRAEQVNPASTRVIPIVKRNPWPSTD